MLVSLQVSNTLFHMLWEYESLLIKLSFKRIDGRYCEFIPSDKIFFRRVSEYGAYETSGYETRRHSRAKHPSQKVRQVYQ